MQEGKLKILFRKYLSNEINELELQEFISLLENCEESVVDELIEEGLNNSASSNLARKEFPKSQVLKSIISKIKKDKFIRPNWNFHRWNITKAAALILLLFSVGYFIQTQLNQDILLNTAVQANEISLPNTGEPLLIRSDGKQYVITEQNIPSLAKEGLKVVKDEKGNDVYKLTEADNDFVVKRTFVSPKGTSQQIELSDGTHIWLNSEASITYSNVFSEHVREIDLSGEAYLKVAHENNRPFIVNINGVKIKVLGTEFNVSPDLYNQAIITTLISGSVEVYTGPQKRLLKPGFQSVSDIKNQTINLKKADLKEITAWRDGYFRFNEDDIQTVLLKIKGWYDIDDISIRNPADDKFSGMIRRTKKLSELFTQLEKISNYKFKIKDGRVLVM